MMEVGRLCVKIAGRDANKKCVVVEVIDDNNVMIDGQTRRRKCNIKHLEPINQVLKVKAGATSADVKKVFSDLGIELKDKKSKKATEKPTKQKAKKQYASEDKKSEKVPKIEKKVADKPKVSSQNTVKEPLADKVEKAESKEKSE